MNATKPALLEKLVEAMGPLPPLPTEPPAYRVLDQVEQDNHLRQEIEYETDDGPAVPAFLLIPHGTEATPAPAALSLQGTHLAGGHRTTVGLAGKPNRDYGHRMAEQGFVVLAPAYPTMGGYEPDFDGLGYRSGTMKAIVDNIRGVDLLLSLPQVRGSSVAAVGLSLGGHNALFTAAFEPRISALATSCGFDSFRDYNGGDVSPWTQERYMPRLTENGAPPFDFDDVLALLSDRALFRQRARGRPQLQVVERRSVDQGSAAHAHRHAGGRPSRMRARVPVPDPGSGLHVPAIRTRRRGRAPWVTMTTPVRP